MQRRLINAMDDLKVANDDMTSVKCANRIIQFEYGEDELTLLEVGSPFDVDQVLNDALGVPTNAVKVRLRRS